MYDRRHIVGIGRKRIPSAALLIALSALPLAASAQFLRVGPFDFTAKTDIGLTYSSNIDLERRSESDQRREDVFLTWSLALGSVADLSTSTQLKFDSRAEFEKHFYRTDLDTEAEPSRLFRLELQNQQPRLKTKAYVEYEYTIDLIEDDRTFRPGGLSAKRRDPLNSSLYGFDAEYKTGPVTLDGGYEHEELRYERPESRDGDSNMDTIEYSAKWQIRERLSVTYDADRQRTEFIRDRSDRPEWLVTENLALDWELPIIERPKVTYSLGVEKEDTKEKKGEWEPTHTLRVEDTWQWNPRWEANARAEYKYEANPEDDDVSFIYSFELINQLNAYAKQTLKLEREPRRTFGSTQETDTQSYDYILELQDVLIVNLDIRYNIGYEINKPPVGEEEKILTQEFRMEHTRDIRPRLKRSATYAYTWEDLSTESEILDEHRVEWKYTYDF